MTTISEIGSSKYVLLTTYRKDGTPKPTPLWAVLEGDELIMWTVRDSWKVKRIRNNPNVAIAACDRAGKRTGPDIHGTAQVLDEAGTDQARTLIRSKYGILGWLAVNGSQLRFGKERTIGISVTAP